MGMGPLENAASAVEAAAAVDAAAAAVAGILPSSAAAVAAVATVVPPAGSYAVLQCGEDSEYVRKAYSGYFQVFRSLLEEDGESWRVYRALRGELPTDAEAAGFDGFVISGSCADAHGDEPWILALVDLIRSLHAAGKRILGVCFGHQDEVALEEAVGDAHEDVLAVLRVSLDAHDAVAEAEHLDTGLVRPRQHLRVGGQLPHLVLVELDHRHVHRQLQRRKQPRRRRRRVDATHPNVPPLGRPPGPSAQRPAQDLHYSNNNKAVSEISPANWIQIHTPSTPTHMKIIIFSTHSTPHHSVYNPIQSNPLVHTTHGFAITNYMFI
ncbi:unnamed protein product [Urochloa humidicola]